MNFSRPKVMFSSCNKRIKQKKTLNKGIVPSKKVRLGPGANLMITVQLLNMISIVVKGK